MRDTLEQLVVRHTHRVPLPAEAVGRAVSAAAADPGGQGAVAARQFDTALMSVGFKLSARLLEHVSGLSEGAVLDTAVRTLRTVRQMVGDHVEHNVYFVDFPANVPDTLDFWLGCIAEALTDDRVRDSTLARLSAGVVDLLTLPSYGRYRHTYAEVLAAHDELTPALGDRMTVLHPGGPGGRGHRAVPRAGRQQHPARRGRPARPAAPRRALRGRAPTGGDTRPREPRARQPGPAGGRRGTAPGHGHRRPPPGLRTVGR